MYFYCISFFKEKIWDIKIHFKYEKNMSKKPTFKDVLLKYFRPEPPPIFFSYLSIFLWPDIFSALRFEEKIPYLKSTFLPFLIGIFSEPSFAWDFRSEKVTFKVNNCKLQFLTDLFWISTSSSVNSPTA